MAALRDAGPDRGRSASRPGPPTASRSTSSTAWSASATLIDWAMVILNPLEPWPGELVLPAAARNDVAVITRVVDYGGLFWDDVRPGHAFAQLRPPRLPARRLGRGGAAAPRAHAPDRRAPRADAAAARVRVEPRPRPGALRGPDAHPGARRRARRSRPSAPSWPPSRPRSCSPRPRSPRSARSATTPAAWRSRAPRRSYEGERAARPLAARRRAARARRRAGRSTPERDLAQTVG